MPKSVWNDGFSKSLGMLLVGGNVDVDAYGEEVEGDSLLVLFNGDHGAPLPFVLPDVQTDSQWEVILTTGDTSEPALLPPGSTLDMEPVSVVVLRLISKPEGE
jgi:hypothetical protein